MGNTKNGTTSGADLVRSLVSDPALLSTNCGNGGFS
jgi:hypothetical protein